MFILGFFLFEGGYYRYQRDQHKYFQNHEGAEKKKIIFPSLFLFFLIENIKNPEKKFIMNQTSRFVYFEEGIMYVMSQNKKGSQYFIKSVSSLDRLFKVYLEVKNLSLFKKLRFNFSKITEQKSK